MMTMSTWMRIIVGQWAAPRCGLTVRHTPKYMFLHTTNFEQAYMYTSPFFFFFSYACHEP